MSHPTVQIKVPDGVDITAVPMGLDSVLLTNNSARSVTALAVRWTIVNSTNGTSKISTARTDSYSVPSARAKPVIGSTSKLIVMPWGFARTGGLAASQPMRQGNAALRGLIEKATSISINLDTVIFDDGVVLGPGLSREVDYIRDRKAAAEALLPQIEAAIQNHKDISSLITSILPPLKLTPDNWFLFWTGLHARRLQRDLSRPDRLRATMIQLAMIPKPPAFRQK